MVRGLRVETEMLPGMSPPKAIALKAGVQPTVLEPVCGSLHQAEYPNYCREQVATVRMESTAVSCKGSTKRSV